MLINMVHIISQCQHLTLINIINTNGFQNLSFNKMTNPSLGHNGYCNSLFNLLNELGVAHSSNPTLSTDIRGHTLQCHDCARARFFSYPCLLRVDDVHDDAASEHLGKPNFDGEC
ncbi:hypothetical protein HanLR1_Chr16g0615781 [Helianthus annuus]|nr:hypothetical protein HanLR1_Chr16g0615781 [Helianthus annuus]